MPSLPLKTVLAYLDDALEPQLLREVGTQIRQDAELQALVERIQRVMRSRNVIRQTENTDDVPDAELIAQYVEGSLDAETAEELERRCLESDAWLAEVAACHQLLHTTAAARGITIPPSSYRRMYSLLHAERQGAARQPAAAHARSETPAALPREEQVFLLGLPSLTQGPWTRRLLVLLIIAALLVGLIVSLYFSLVRPGAPSEWAGTATQPGSAPAQPTAAQDEKPKPPEPTPERRLTLDSSRGRNIASLVACLPALFHLHDPLPWLVTAFIPENAWEAAPGKPATGEPSKPIVIEDVKIPPGAERLPEPLQPREVSALLGPVSVPQAGEGLIATHAAAGVAETLLWRWSAAGRAASLLKPQERIPANSLVQVWPGYRATLRLDSGVQVELVGNVPELHAEPVLDASLRLHPTRPGYHLDASLERGWFVIQGRQEESLIRLRVADEVWDMVLPPGNTRILVTVQWRLQRGQEPPASQPFLTFSTLRHGVLWRRSRTNQPATVYSVPAQSLVLPDVPGLARLADALPESGKPPIAVVAYETPPAWAQAATKLPTHVSSALANFQRHIFQRAIENPARPLDGAKQGLLEELDDPQATALQQRLAVFGLAASDQLEELVRILEQRQQSAVRLAAREALHYWLGQHPHHAKELRQSVVQQLGYSEAQAALLVELLRGYAGPGVGVAERLLQIMQHERSPALRYLAVSNLRELYPNLRDNYSPDAPEEARAKAISAIQRQLK